MSAPSSTPRRVRDAEPDLLAGQNRQRSALYSSFFPCHNAIKMNGEIGMRKITTKIEKMILKKPVMAFKRSFYKLAIAFR